MNRTASLSLCYHADKLAARFYYRTAGVGFTPLAGKFNFYLLSCCLARQKPHRICTLCAYSRKKSYFLRSKLEILFTKLVPRFVFQIGRCICIACETKVVFFLSLEAERRLLGHCFLVLVSTQGRFAWCDCLSLLYAVAALHCVGLGLTTKTDEKITRLKNAGADLLFCVGTSSVDTDTCLFSCEHS